MTTALTAALFTACGSEQTQTQTQTQAQTQDTQQTADATKNTAEKAAKYPDTHTLYFKDSAKSGKAVATFFNSVSGKSEDVEMKKMSEDKTSVTFSCEGKCSEYNMAYITCGDKKLGNSLSIPASAGGIKRRTISCPTPRERR